MIKSIKMFKVGDHGEVPGPEVFWMKDFGLWYPLFFYSFLVDTSDGLVLVNTGPPTDLSLRNKFLKEWAGSDRCHFSVSEEERIENALGRVGASPDDIRHIIISPFQDYSIGRLDLFPKARIYFSKKGWFEDAVTPKAAPFLNRDVYFPKEVRHYLFEEAWERIVLVEDEEEIVRGVSVKWTGGHHKSSMAVLLETGGGGVISITDTAFTQRNILEDIPIGIAESIQECLDAYKFLKGKTKTIIPAYDPENLQRFKQFLA